MTSLTLTHPDGAVTEHTIKQSWADVSIAEFAACHAAIAGLKPVRQLLPAATFLSTIPRDVLAGNVALCKKVVDLCPWLREEPTPEINTPIAAFEHRGVAYAYVGDLSTISVGRYEALVNVLEAAGDQPMAAVPGLVALLYMPADRRFDKDERGDPTPEAYEAVARALADLPISIAYPAVRFFFHKSTRCLVTTQRFIAARADAERAVMELEKLMAETASEPRSTSCWSKWRMRVLQACLRSVKSRLQTS